jgi:hypothetical protein
MRGGTSKGVFVREEDLPGPGHDRDELIRDLMGSPDPMQLDGLGGTHANTSKVMIIRSSRQPEFDVEYTAVQVASDTSVVDYSGNCGNLTAAVGAYAIDEGFVAAREPITTVRMLNLNTNVTVIAYVPIEQGKAAYRGDYRMDGVPGTGAPIRNEYLCPAGSVFGRLFPTGHPLDTVESSRGQLEVSILDVAHPMAFVRAADLGLRGDETAPALNGDSDLLVLLEQIRGMCSVLLGAADRAEEASIKAPSLPRLAIVAPAMTPSAHITARMLSMGRFIHAYAMTGVICTAAACRFDGTIPHSVASAQSDDEVRISHPSGVAAAAIALENAADGPTIRSATVIRTARRLLEGVAYLKAPLAPVSSLK